MKLLREYIRELLIEARFNVSDLEELDYTIWFTSDGESFDIKLLSDWPPERRGRIVGQISGFEAHPGEEGQCLGAHVVTWSAVQDSGWGPLLYDLAIEYATSKGSGLASDRSIVSDDAHFVWDKYLATRQGDVEMVQMDDMADRLTPGSENDNCKMTMAYARGLPDGTWWDEDEEDNIPWDPYGKNVLEKSSLSKMARWKGAPNIQTLKDMGRWKEGRDPS